MQSAAQHNEREIVEQALHFHEAEQISVEQERAVHADVIIAAERREHEEVSWVKMREYEQFSQELQQSVRNTETPGAVSRTHAPGAI